MITGPESPEEHEALPVRMTPFGPAHVIPTGETNPVYRVEFDLPNPKAVRRELRKLTRGTLRAVDGKVKRVPKRKRGNK